MMATIFWIITFLYIVILIAVFIRTHKLVTIPNIIFLMTTLNFILYLQNWSNDIIEPCADITYFMMTVVEIIFAVYALFPVKNHNVNYKINIRIKKINFGRFKISLAALLLGLCMLLAATENIYLCNSFFTNDSSIHTSSMPIIGTILRGIYPVAYIITFLEFENKHSKLLVIEFVICNIYALIGGGSRYWSIVSIVTFIVFVCYYKKEILKNVHFGTKVLILIAIIGMFDLYMRIGLSRNISSADTQFYSSWISYTGPLKGTSFENLFAWFYGYFPYSFNNLNVTLLNIYHNNIFTGGKFLIYPFVSFLHLDGIMEIDYGTLALNGRIINNTAATVATGYFEFYSDFGDLFVISIIFFVALTRMFEKKNSFFKLVSFSAMFSVWFLMGFNNLFSAGITIYTIVISLIIEKIFIIQDIQSNHSLQLNMR